MRRREFIMLLSGAAAAWPLPAQAQQTRLPIIGFVGTDATAWSPWTTAFVQRLHELGWTEGRTVAIEYRWNEGQPERIAEIAAEFVRLKVDVIVTNAIATPALKQATTVIPIVFAIALDNRSSPSMLQASGSNSCVRLSPIYGGWQFCLMLTSLNP